MKTEELKKQLRKVNKRLELLLHTEIRIRYDKPTCFQFIDESSEWKLMRNGTNLNVHPLFYDQFVFNIRDIMLALNQTFNFRFYDPELYSHYQDFKNNLFLIAHKLYDLDREEERRGLNYLTYEQLINSTCFTFYHLCCLFFDQDIGFLSDADFNNYVLSIFLFEFYQSKSDSTRTLLLRAYDFAEIKVSSEIFEILTDEEWTESLKLLLKDPNGQCA